MRLRNIPEAEEIVRNSKWVLPCPKGAAASSFALPGGGLRPLSVEIGMGKGAFLLEMARRYPDEVFLGVERYESVLLRAVQKMDALEEEGSVPANLLFLCEDAAILPEILPAGSVQKIYLNFSDPWPKKRHAHRRLTSERFLAVYEKILAEGGTVTFKTDNRGLFDYSLETAQAAERWEVLSVTYDLHKDVSPEDNIMTEYERKFSNLGSKICRMIIRYKGQDREDGSAAAPQEPDSGLQIREN